MPRTAKDLTGERFGRLVVLARAENSMTGHPRWLCRCDCGEQVVRLGEALRNGSTRSCGCYNREMAAKRQLKHGWSRREKRDRLYATWNMMKQRCGNPNNQSYKNYGARGIRVCREWEQSYDAFRTWALENGYDPAAERFECTIDRIDNDGNYEPKNCRIVNREIQANNTRSNRWAEYNGERKTIAQWSEATGIGATTIAWRINNGWPLERALTERAIPGKNQNWRGENEY